MINPKNRLDALKSIRLGTKFIFRAVGFGTIYLILEAILKQKVVGGRRGTRFIAKLPCIRIDCADFQHRHSRVDTHSPMSS